MSSQLPRLSIVITSTREGRVGPAIGKWFEEVARTHGGFEVDLVDLALVALPLLDEPNHPNQRNYQKEHTKAWSARVAATDAFAFVVPEYNYGMPPALLNALDYVYHEWHYKAAGFVSYGGQSGGLRSVQMAKPVLTTLRMMPIPEGVTVQFFSKYMKESGQFEPEGAFDKPAKAMLDELLRWTKALETLRP
jgi:NAD(P)H-dependent FMN reductase